MTYFVSSNFCHNDAAIDIAEAIRIDLRRFIDLMEDDKTLNLQTFGVKMTPQKGIALLRSAYKIPP